MRQRIELWKQVYDQDDNAISRALSEMTWNLTAFSCVVEMVRSAPERDGQKQLNGMLMEMLVSGFWSATMQGVRRLAEKGSIHGARGICSLRGLVADVRDVRCRLTRRVFVEEIAGLPYNYEMLADREQQFILAHGPGGVDLPRELDSVPSEQRHAAFDWLSGTSPSTSHPNDVIRDEVFEVLEGRLARLDAVVEHVNVEIAHAGTEFSRSGRVLERWNLSDAKDAIKELVQIAELVGEWFCFSGVGSVLPQPQFDQFAHLDKAFYPADTQPLQDVWDDLAAEISQWQHISPEEL